MTKLGRQTPTVAYFVTYDRTLSEEVIELYQKTGLKVYEWQKNLLEPLMAIYLLIKSLRNTCF